MYTITVNGKEYAPTNDIYPASEGIWYKSQWYTIRIEEKPKEYEILSFKFSDDLFGSQILAKDMNGQFGKYLAKEIDLLSSPIHPIYQVKRLSDGEVLTVGKITIEGSDIEYFKIKNGELVVGLKWLLNHWETNIASISKQVEQKPILFTTTDLVNIYEGDEYHAVQKKTFDMIINLQGKLIYPEQWATFSTLEAATEYILFNKPMQSLNDLLNVWAGDEYTEPDYFKNDPLFLKFKEAAKLKIKQPNT